LSHTHARPPPNYRFFPATVYLSTSKLAVAAVGNLSFAVALCMYNVIIKVCVCGCGWLVLGCCCVLRWLVSNLPCHAGWVSARRQKQPRTTR
jgi:hypothetical protein